MLWLFAAVGAIIEGVARHWNDLPGANAARLAGMIGGVIGVAICCFCGAVLCSAVAWRLARRSKTAACVGGLVGVLFVIFLPELATGTGAATYALGESERPLVGKWVETSPPSVSAIEQRRLRLSCRADHTFTEVCDVLDAFGREDAEQRFEFSGNWHVEGDTFICDVTGATRLDMTPKGTWRYSIVSVDAYSMVLKWTRGPIALPDSEGERIIRFHRLPEQQDRVGTDGP